MSSAPSNTSSSAAGAGTHQARLALKPDGPASGYVDGGWWPRSRDLQAELPVLLEELRHRLGRAEMVTYHLGEWRNPPRTMIDHGLAVRLAGYRLQRFGSVDIIAPNRRATLLVVDPESTTQCAHDALAACADEHNTDDITALLARTQPVADTTQEVQR